jgi:hypothetical protein
MRKKKNDRYGQSEQIKKREFKEFELSICRIVCWG